MVEDDEEADDEAERSTEGSWISCSEWFGSGGAGVDVLLKSSKCGACWLASLLLLSSLYLLFLIIFIMLFFISLEERLDNCFYNLKFFNFCCCFKCSEWSVFGNIKTVVGPSGVGFSRQRGPPVRTFFCSCADFGDVKFFLLRPSVFDFLTLTISPKKEPLTKWQNIWQSVFEYDARMTPFQLFS